MIPQGWQEKRLWEVTDWDKRFQSITNGKQRKILSFNHILAETMKTISVDNGDIKLLATGKFDGYTTEKLAGDNLNEGEVLTLPSGGTASIKYYNGKFVDSGNIIAQSTDTKRYYLKYIYYYLISINDFVASKYKGASIKHPYMPEILEITIPLPPLPEQERIVAKLDKAFEAVDKAKTIAETNLKNAKELFESSLNNAFTKNTEECEEEKLGKVCKITSKLIDPRLPQNQNLLHVGAANIEQKNGNLVNLMTAKEEKLISNKFIFDNNMVLYSKIRPYLMKVVRPNFTGLCSADIYPLLPDTKYITRDYLFYLLLSKPFTDYAIEGSARAGMPKVNRPHLFAYSCKLPTVYKQQKIVEKLDALQEQTKQLEAIYTQKIKECDELKQSILQKAFRGEL